MIFKEPAEKDSKKKTTGVTALHKRRYLKVLPEWFDLKKYERAAALDAESWNFQIAIRCTCFDHLCRMQSPAPYPPEWDGPILEALTSLRSNPIRTRRVNAQNLTAKEREKYFVSLYVKAGAVEEKIPYAERRASLKPGTGQRILQRKKVQEEVKARMEPLVLVRKFQQVTSEAAAQVAAKFAEKAAKAEADNEKLKADLGRILTLPKMPLDSEVAEHQLMVCVIQDIDLNVKLAAIERAFVLNGTLEIKSKGRWLGRR
jgi:hypothetical protein